MDGEKLNIISSFDMIFDTDYGIIKTIVDKYNNPKFTNDEYLKKISFNGLIKDICNQEEKDPLKLAFKNEVNYKDLYNTLYETEMESIVYNSTPTNILRMFQTYINYEMADITIICENELQKSRVKDLEIDCKIIGTDFDIEKYDCLYIRDYHDLDNRYKNIKHKNIYIANCRYNMEEIQNGILIPNKEIATYSLDNEINLIKLY